MAQVPFTETLLESASIFKISKAKMEVKGSMKMSGDCSVHVNIADMTIKETKGGRRLICPYKYIFDDKTVQPTFGADGYAGTVKYPDGQKFTFKVTFPNGEFPEFMDTVVTKVIVARHEEKKAAKKRESIAKSQQNPVGYINPNNMGVVYVPVQAPTPAPAQFYPQSQPQQYYYGQPAAAQPMHAVVPPMQPGEAAYAPGRMQYGSLASVAPAIAPAPAQPYAYTGPVQQMNNPYELPPESVRIEPPPVSPRVNTTSQHAPTTGYVAPSAVPEPTYEVPDLEEIDPSLK